MKFYLLAALLTGALFSAPAFGQAGKTANGYTVAAAHLTLEFNDTGNLVAVNESIGKFCADGVGWGQFSQVPARSGR